MKPTPLPHTPKRGAAENPTGRFENCLYVPDEEERALQEETVNRTQIFYDRSKTIIAKNSSPDVGFDRSLNPYRGCEHGCVYCYARPTHEYLGFSIGLDFETKIVVKEDAPALLKAELAKKTYEPQPLALSGVTDAYQPLEARLGLTRQCLEILTAARHPVWIITKNALIARDLDLLRELAKYNAVGVAISITTLDRELCARLEPRASRPAKRLETLCLLNEAGIPAGVNVAPILPGLTEHEIPAILKAASEAKAAFAGRTVLRLPYGIKDLFEHWLETHFPDRKSKVLSRIRDIREGKLNESQFGARMQGHGKYAEMIHDQFTLWTQRLKLGNWPRLSAESFVRPRLTSSQLELEL